MGKKICNICNENKNIDEFYIGKNQCKSCLNLRKKEYFQKNKLIILQKHKEWRDKNPNYMSEYSKKYYIDNRDESLERFQNRYLNKKEIILQKHKEWRDKNPNYMSEYSKKYCLDEKNKEKRRKRDNNRLKTDNNFKIIKLLRSRLSNILRNNKADHTLELLGCSFERLKQHLQQTAINNGYLNFDINTYSGKDYHIDHVIPCSAFNFKCSYHQKLCFNWSNLQILTSKENISKHDKVSQTK